VDNGNDHSVENGRKTIRQPQVRVICGHPTKSFGSAKQRNAAVLSPRQRMGLAEAVLRDVLRALVAAMELAGINVPVT